MKIGIFAKCGHVGGSEFRCAELANGIIRYTKHQAFLFCEGMIHPKVLKTVDETVSVRLNVVKIQDTVPIFLRDGCHLRHVREVLLETFCAERQRLWFSTDHLRMNRHGTELLRLLAQT